MFRTTLLATAMLLVSAALASAETVWVKSESADIRSGKGSIYDSILTVKKGQPLEITQHDGHWMQVKIDPTHSGWVFDSAISPTQVAGSNGLFNMQPGTVGQLSSGAAAKGFDESTNSYAANKHYNKAPLQSLIDLRHKIAPAEWERFNQAVQTGKE